MATLTEAWAKDPVVCTLEVVGALTPLIFFAVPWKTIAEVRSKQSVGKLSPMPFTSMVLKTFLYLLVGLGLRNASIIFSNAIGFLLGLFYTGAYHSNCKDDGILVRKHYPILMMIGGLGLLCLAAGEGELFSLSPTSGLQLRGKDGLDLVAMGVAVAMYAAPAMELVSLFQSGAAVDGGFVAMSFVGVLDGGVWLFYGFVYVQRVSVWLPNGLGFLANAISLLLLASRGGGGASRGKPPSKEKKKN